MPIIVDVPGVGPTEFPDENAAASFFKNQGSQVGPQDLGGELAAPQTPQIPDRINQLKAYAEQLDPASKEYKKYMEAYKAELDSFLKLNPAPKLSKFDLEADDFNKKIGGQAKNIKYAFDVLDKIEPGEGILGVPYGLVQRAVDKLGLNPEVGQYESLINGLVSAVARNVGQEKGALAEGDVTRIKALFPSIYENTAERNAKKENFVQLLNNATGQDFTESFLGKKLSQPQTAQSPGGLNINQDAIAAALSKKRALRGQ